MKNPVKNTISKWFPADKARMILKCGTRFGIFFVMALGVLLSASAAHANDIYVAQYATGSATGTSCSAARAVGALASGDWVGGNTIHLCGTITSTISAQGSGSSGSPITVLFESGAKLSQPYCPYNGCLNIDSRSYITVDGGTNGIIESTANGTGLANQKPSEGIEARPCNNCEVKNLTIRNIYIHNSVSDTVLSNNDTKCLYMGGSNWLVHDNTMHDAGWCIDDAFINGDSNVRIYSNNVYNVDHGVAPAGYGTDSASNFYVYGNHIHDYSNWDTTADVYHHDGVHSFGTSGASLTNLEIYNNLFDGNPGADFTSHIYLEGGLTNTLVFNNIVDGSEAAGTFGLIGVSSGSSTGGQVYNNTIIGANINANYCILVLNGNTNIENNIMTGCWAGIFQYAASPSVTMSYNTYANIGSCGIGYSTTAVCYSTLASWQSYTGQDAHSQKVTSATLNGTFVPNSGSPVIGAGTNLTSLNIAPLDYDIMQAPRPSSGTWTAGAYNSGSTASEPNPPSGLSVIVQ